ncbi:MAG: hypothetical protein GC161_01620 [Planctomycetaceae bacterium]|nr:hypothetical protein [Planctomycetaceae bacterium]
MAAPAPLRAAAAEGFGPRWHVLVQALVLGLVAAFVYALALQPSLYSVDPPKFLDMYTEARWSASGSPHHHHVHYAVWWLLRALVGDDYIALEYASLLPAALAIALLFVYLRTRALAGALSASLVAGVVAGSSPVWFFATAAEVHGAQLLLAVVALFCLARAAEARTFAARLPWVALTAAALLLGHPLHALLLPFVGLWCYLAWGGHGDTGPRRWIGTGVAGALLVGAALVRYIDVESRQGWSTNTLSSWAEHRRFAVALGSLWDHLLRANLLLWPIVVFYLAGSVRDLGRRLARVAAVLALVAPLALFVAYVGIFEFGGYFVALGAWAAACFGGPFCRWLDVRAVRLPNGAVPLVFGGAFAASVWLSGGLELWRRENPSLVGDEAAAVEFAKSRLAPLDAVAVFEPRLADALRRRSRRATTPELAQLLLAMPEGTESHLLDGYLERHRPRFERGGALWVFRWVEDPADLDPRRAWLQERLWTRVEQCPEAREERIGGLRVLGPARTVLGDL